jgi:hypothetical protein
MKPQLWYYQSNAAELGPVTADELLFLARSGRIAHQTIVRPDGSQTGQPFAAAFPTAAADSSRPHTRPSRSTRPRESAAATDQKSAATAAPATAPRPPSLPPPLKPTTASSRTPVIAVTATALALLLLVVCLWWFLPRTPPGMADAQSGPGAAAAGTQQSADDSSSTAADTLASDTAADTAAAAETATQPPAASAAATANADTSTGNSTATAGTTEAADNTASADASLANSEPTSPPGDFGTASGQPAAGDQPPEPADGLLVGSQGDERFAISAPGETTFFGLRGQGRRFSWVVDCSGSMQGPPLERARQELLNSLRKLPQGLEFQVIFFDDLPSSFPSSGFAQKDPQTLAEAEEFIAGIQGGGGTNVMQGMRQMFSQRSKPDTAFLLTDGEFDPSTPEFIRSRNRGGKVRINTVAFVNRDGEPLLRQIARENRGDFRFVP